MKRKIALLFVLLVLLPVMVGSQGLDRFSINLNYKLDRELLFQSFYDYLSNREMKWFLPEETFDNRIFWLRQKYDITQPAFLGKVNFQLNNKDWGQLFSLSVDYGLSLSGQSRPREAEISFFIFPLGKVKIRD